MHAAFTYLLPILVTFTGPAFAQPQSVPVLSEAGIEDLDRKTFWDLSQVPALTDKRGELLADGDCNVVVYLSGAQARAKAGKENQYARQYQFPATSLTSHKMPWWWQNAGSPWCASDAVPDSDKDFPEDSVPFVKAYGEDEDDGLLSFGDLHDSADNGEEPNVAAGSCHLIYDKSDTQEKVNNDYPDFDIKLKSIWCDKSRRIPDPSKVGKGNLKWNIPLGDALSCDFGKA